MPEFNALADSMLQAMRECDQAGLAEHSLLWRDAMHYLMAQRAEIEQLRLALLLRAGAMQ